ncbi:MAG: alpha-2-macroglobulin [Saprospiraceae bacterium]
MSNKINNYVYAYTSGVISNAAPVRVRFVSAVVDKSKIGAVTKSDLIWFTPKIDGTAIWEDDRTILFTPTESLAPNQNYVGNVSLQSLFEGVEEEVKVFEFDFRTKELFFEVTTEGMQTVNKDTKEQELSGKVFISDAVAAENVEALLVAEYNGKAMPIRWNHANTLNHQFTIPGIQRNKEDTDLVLTWKGSPIGVKENGTQAVSIPAIGNFKVMNARVVQHQDQYFVLQFSDPLSQAQNFTGLVRIKDYDGKLKFTVDGNQLRVYPSKRISGSRTVNLYPGILNTDKVKMQQAGNWKITFVDSKPQVRLVGQGVIMPNSDGLVLPFEAISLDAVDVEVFKIYNDNILQFLQTNQLDGGTKYYNNYDYEYGHNYGGDLARVGRIVLQKKVSLSELNPTAKAGEWTRYALDLRSLIVADPYAIYQVRIGFRKNYTNYACESDDPATDNLATIENPFDEEGEIKSIMNGSAWYSGYRYKHKKDPCYPAYYHSENFVQRNIFSSNLGMLAKQGEDGSVLVVVTDLRTSKPIENVHLEFYDYQQQLLRSANTDKMGMVKIDDLEQKPFIVMADHDEQKGYLRLIDGSSLSLSRFDVAGNKTQKGLKGFIYGDRGVWRPGDSIYLDFVLEDKSGKLPVDHPVSFELYDARGQLQQKRTSIDNVNNIYPLACATAADAPTGNWRALVKVGGASFQKYLKVEAVKPNRLKIDLDFGKAELAASDLNLQGDLKVNWLHGAPAKNLKAKVEVQLKGMTTQFDDFKKFIFDDARRKVKTEPFTLFDGKVDAQGMAKVSTKFSNTEAAPGKLKANFKIRAFEKGGDFSIDNSSIIYHPYETYAGINIPEDKYGQRQLKVNEASTISFAAVSKDGQAKGGKSLDVGLYRVNWRWWWDQDNDNSSQFNSGNHHGAIKTAQLTTKQNGKVDWTVAVTDWGRYLVRVCDPVSGHCAGTYFYAGYPWYEEGGSFNRQEAAMLAFAAGKKTYEVGDQIELSIPTGEEGRALISIENGTTVLETYWLDAKPGENIFKFEATEKMTPTIYANVALIQPHGQVKNDLPMRMYGVIPIRVEDPATKLEPKIKMPEVLEPESSVVVEVSEGSGKAMAYTIALVDDGLLDLTNFQTPDPWNHFYAREALGVKTWDLYDKVLGAYGGNLERILSIGGDGEKVKVKEGKKANRFEPVVRHLGPFFLNPGKKAQHKIEIPNYVGSVRTMVVAANKTAYGSAEKTTPVRKPLMVLATLPRVLGPTEKLRLPVTVFAMEKKVKAVKITAKEVSGLVNFVGGTEQSLNFDGPGEQMAYFDIEVDENIGVAKFVVTATGGGETASQEIEIDVRNPNPFVTDVKTEILQASADWNISIDPVGIIGTNKAILEVSSIPPINLGSRLDYLLRYPHGCLEQTTSTAFPLLYVDRLLELNSEQKEKLPKIVRATIERLKNFQMGDGGFAYWPGSSSRNLWSLNYVCHFLLEAKAKGYTMPPMMLERALALQKKLARKWDPEQDRLGLYGRNSNLMQAYRLYVLALANAPEVGAMNRLRERSKLANTAKWRLAASYALVGQQEVAEGIINNLSTEVKDYQELSYSFGSGLRDRAMILETLTILGQQKEGAELLQLVANGLSGGQWHSTQTVAYSLLAIGKYIGKQKISKEFNFSYSIAGQATVNAGSNSPMMQIEIPIDGTASQNLNLKNTTNNGLIYARLISSGQPVIGDQTVAENDLKLKVVYKNLKGESIDPASIEQGMDFYAQVTVTNPGRRGINYQEMALTQVFPSGWEIQNTRMDNLSRGTEDAKPTYRDIRDDRVYAYFDIPKNKTKVYTVQLNAAYPGRYYLPSVSCAAMYDNTISARQPGKWVEVVRPQGL